MDGGLPIPTQPLDGVQLCHYPVRSVAQYAGKIAVGYLQYLATPDWDRAIGFHYIKPFQNLAKGGLHAIKNRMKQDFLFYSPDESKNEQNNPQATEAPLNYLGGPLTLTPRRGSTTLPNVLGHAEMMATELAVNLKRSRTFDRLSTEYAVLQKRLAEELELPKCAGKGSAASPAHLGSGACALTTAARAHKLSGKRQPSKPSTSRIWSMRAHNCSEST